MIFGVGVFARKTGGLKWRRWQLERFLRDLDVHLFGTQSERVTVLLNELKAHAFDLSCRLCGRRLRQDRQPVALGESVTRLALCGEAKVVTIFCSQRNDVVGHV